MRNLVYLCGIIALAILGWNTYAISGLPEETRQGVVFKIIFFHVPVAITADWKIKAVADYIAGLH